MSPRGYREVFARLPWWPGRLWCALTHKGAWKPFGRVRVIEGHLWMECHCWTCGRSHLRPVNRR